MRPVPATLALALALALATPARAADPARPDPAALVGKPPPPIQVAAWVKGEPLDRLAPGKVWVVDFWATWCGPCKAAIPHLSRLAREHRGRIEVVGVSIAERQDSPADTNYIAVVRRFVARMGDQMDYRVAVDTPDKRMHATWYTPTGTGGIPTAYIVGTNGLVAWTGIGTPEDVGRIASEVLAGTFDPRKEAERAREAEAGAARRSAADIAAAKARGDDARYPGYAEAMRRGDSAAALASLDAAFKADPASETSGAYQWKLMLLLQRNKVPAVEAYARDLVARHGDDDDIVGFVSACIVATGEEARFDTALALDAARRTDAAAKPGTRWAQFARWRLGWALWHRGERAKAIEAVESALEGVRRLKATIDFGNLEAECEEALRVFRAK